MAGKAAARARATDPEAEAPRNAARLRAEVTPPPPADDEEQLPPGVVAGVLCGQRVRVKPYLDWPTLAIVHERQSDYETWAAYCLYGDDYETVWRPLRPTVRQVYEFFNTWRENSGQDVGESAASSRS